MTHPITALPQPARTPSRNRASDPALARVIAIMTAVVMVRTPSAAATTISTAPVDFQREIRPLLANLCLPCHGFDASSRKAGLRLDLRDNALAPARSGTLPIVPGQPDHSELLRRLEPADPADRMPPPDSRKSTTPAQRELLRRWVAQGAPYSDHWSYIPPVLPPIPTVRHPDQARHPVDRFIVARLEAAGLTPASEASPTTLIRRLALDLTGLPPTHDEIDRFLADSAPGAWERLVDRLLASPRLGERLAQDWLDAARYADSNGYQVDRDRELWAWRDWVIHAFNSNLPFDRFTLEQLAGDLLPNATRDQRIATGFHRNAMINEEGGIIPEEFLVEYGADRVETTATVWLGLTFNCARCHDHKYDPFSQRDYYGLFAFFNNIAENGVGNYSAPIRRNTPPFLQLTTPESDATLARLKDELAQTRTRPDLDPTTRSNRIATLTRQIDAADLAIPVTLVLDELPKPRPTHILMRGAYDRPGDPVTSDTPRHLPPFPTDQPRNRLGLARWLTDPHHPLTGRVTVNRLWQSLFGTGLVRTSEDFGTQGDPPSHPELLDWLAREFVDTGWDVKRLIRLLVTSATYRQDSRTDSHLAAIDPDNRLLARGPRHRLPAETLRDQALAVSGLLVDTPGGPSVKPYHPPGLYEQVVAGSSADTYVQDSGASLYRRTLYTYWKRSVPNPALLVFDFPFRETCTVRRARTSTPLQALNLLNDPTYVEAARVLARRMLREGGASPSDRIRLGFRLATGRLPNPAELSLLESGLHRRTRALAARPDAARQLLRVGASPEDAASATHTGPTAAAAAVELAAYATVAATLLNLDETITRE